MALVIEDGSIVAGATSYITVVEYNTWADARFGSARATAPADDAAAEQLILRAMDYFEAQSFKGYLVEQTQPLQWPRSWVVIDGYSVDPDEIPKEVKNSLYELAYAEEQGEGELNVLERKVTSEKVGPVAVSYSDSSSSRNSNVAVSSSMKKLLQNSGGGFAVSRA